MNKLIEAINSAGLSITPNMDDDQIKKIAKAMGLDPIDYIKREVKIKQHTNKRGETNTFIVTPPFVVSKKVGKAKTVAGVWLRLEALDQALKDLLVARTQRDNKK